MELGGAPVDLGLHLDVVALCVGLLVGYAALIRRYGPLFHPRPGERAVRPGRVTAFVAGVLVLWGASGSPLHDIGEQLLFSAHMIEHLLHALVVAPLLLLGTPGWMLEVVVRGRVRRVVRVLARPIVAGLLFNVVLVTIHVPDVLELMITGGLAHAVMHGSLLGAAILMWLPVLSSSPAVAERMSPLGQMFYLFLMTMIPTVPASFLTFGEAPLYSIYETFPRAWGFSALDDMRTAGLIMKIGGGFLLWGVIATIYFRWAAGEERRDAAPPPTPSGSPNRLPTA